MSSDMSAAIAAVCFFNVSKHHPTRAGLEHMTAVHADHCCHLIPTLNRFNVNYRINILRLQERLTWSASSDGACVGIVMSWVSISMFIITSPRSRLWKRFETNWKQIDARLQLHWFEGLRRTMAFSNTQGVALKWIQWPWKRLDALEQFRMVNWNDFEKNKLCLS